MCSSPDFEGGLSGLRSLKTTSGLMGYTVEDNLFLTVWYRGMQGRRLGRDEEVFEFVGGEQEEKNQKVKTLFLHIYL